MEGCPFFYGSSYRCGICVYTNYVVKKLAAEEQARVNLNVEAIRLIGQTQDVEALTFMAEILKSNTTIPVIITDSTGEINAIPISGIWIL